MLANFNLWKERIIAKSIKCPECGTEILGSANFCPNCGAPIKQAAAKKAKQTDVTSEKSHLSKRSLSFLTAAFVFSLIVILLILSSNRKALERKVLSQQQNAPAGQMPANHPDMEKMQHIQDIKDQLAADPDNVDLMIHLANNYFDIGRFDLARDYYKKAIEHKTKKPEVFIDLGVSYFNLSKLDSALYFVDEALKLAPQHRLGLFNKGVIEYNLKQYKQAIATWEKLIKLHPQTQEATTAQQFIKEAQKMVN